MDVYEEILTRERGGTEKTEEGTNWFAALEMPAIIIGKTDSQIDVCGKNHS